MEKLKEFFNKYKDYAMAILGGIAMIVLLVAIVFCTSVLFADGYGFLGVLNAVALVILMFFNVKDFIQWIETLVENHKDSGGNTPATA